MAVSGVKMFWQHCSHYDKTGRYFCFTEIVTSSICRGQKIMENRTIDESQSDGGCRPEFENKRKRHFSSTQSNGSPKKKTFVSDGGDVGGDDQPQCSEVNTYNEELQTQFLLEELCDEVLYEIFKFLDTWALMSLMNVCRRFQKFVLDKRLWEKIDLCEEPLPLGILEDMLERSHEKTISIKLRGPSPSQHIDGEIQHLNKTIRNSFTTRCTKLVTLELYGVTLDFNHIKLKDFPTTLNRLVLNTCNVRVVSSMTLFSGIDTILVNLEELAVEYNSWFDPYNVMPLSKLPLLRYLSLRGCWQMQEFIPYGSVAARHGFKQLEILDLRDTPLNDSDLQCFNAVESLKEIYLQCPEDETSEKALSSTKPQSDTVNSKISNFITDSRKLTDAKKHATSNELSVNSETPSTSMSTAKYEKFSEALLPSVMFPLNVSESTSSSSSSSSSPPMSGSSADNNSAAGPALSTSRNIVPLVGTNIPTRSRFLPRPDHIFYLDVFNRTSPNAVHFNIRDHNNLRHLRLPGQIQQNQQQSPPPVIEQMMRHNLFWDIVNPLGRVVGVGGSDRLFGEENGAEYHLNLFSLSSNRQQSRGTISDRGVCCFGRTRQPVQQGVIWIRFNNRPRENRFERFSVRNYKFVTDVSLEHLVQCSPHLTFLDVSGTSVTLEGLQRFKDLKPECNVVAEHLLGVTKSETRVS